MAVGNANKKAVQTSKDKAQNTAKPVQTTLNQTTLKVDAPKAAEKKTTDTKPAAKAAEPAKAATPKTVEKPAAKAAEEKPTAKRATTRRATRKSTARKTSKATIRKAAAEADSEVFIQTMGEEFSQQAIMEKVVAAWEAEGKKITSMKKTKLYVKPEERKAYYVVNEGLKNGSTGAVDL